MLDAVTKNLWLVLTLALPGLATYGTWRLILLMDQVDVHLSEGLKQLDASVFLSTSIVFSIALLQQAIAIAVEAILALIATKIQSRAPQLHALLCRRFQLAATGKLDENGTRIVGNLFLSMNVTVGLILLLVFFLVYQHKPMLSPVPMILGGLLLASIATTIFRLFNAKWVVHSAMNQAEHNKTDAGDA